MVNFFRGFTMLGIIVVMMQAFQRLLLNADEVEVEMGHHVDSILYTYMYCTCRYWFTTTKMGITWLLTIQSRMTIYIQVNKKPSL